jgi:hypothetical protein
VLGLVSIPWDGALLWPFAFAQALLWHLLPEPALVVIMWLSPLHVVLWGLTAGAIMSRRQLMTSPERRAWWMALGAGFPVNLVVPAVLIWWFSWSEASYLF